MKTFCWRHSSPKTRDVCAWPCVMSALKAVTTSVLPSPSNAIAVPNAPPRESLRRLDIGLQRPAGVGVRIDVNHAALVPSRRFSVGAPTASRSPFAASARFQPNQSRGAACGAFR